MEPALLFMACPLKAFVRLSFANQQRTVMMHSGQKGTKNTLQHGIGPCECSKIRDLLLLLFFSVLLIAQFFGVLPVSGVWPSSRPDKVRFRWISLSLLAALVLFTFSIVDCVLSAKRVLDNGLKIYTIGKNFYLVFIYFLI